MNNKTMVKDLTQGNVAKLLIAFTLPLFLSNSLQAAYNIVDMVIVGQFIGGPGISAVSIGGDILHLITFIAIGFASAGQVIIARKVGEGKIDELSHIIGTMFSFLLLCALGLSIICFIFRNAILTALNTPDESYEYAMDYMVTCIFGLVFIYGYNIVSAILRGMGDGKRPFVFVAIAAILNTVLDYVFVVICKIGVFGAALATVIGQGVSFIVSIIYLYVKRESFGFDFKLKSFLIRKEVLKPLVSLGIPMSIQSAAISFSRIILTAWINIEGVMYSALGGIYNKMGAILGVAGASFIASGSTMVGQNLGAKKYDRVPQIMGVIIAMGAIISTIFSIAVYFFPQKLFSLFTNDQQVLSLASLLSIPSVLFFAGSALRNGFFCLINGSGNTKMNFAIALLDAMIARIGIAYFMCFKLGMGSLGCWYGDALAGFVPVAIGIGFYASMKWKK
ncbi:MAG: MATE family efflux transporter [Sphaerochaetaceae bacterium]|nr:MATE family efflux transporter [Sphaerochaetaceae bacterium]